jgi:alpha-L-fucosidase
MLALTSVRAETPLKADPQTLENWREARFGMFIHWGPVSLKGTEISSSRNPGPNGAIGSIPAAKYDNLYKQFNPTRFNATEWVAVAKSAGMKYLVFTAKHHDGFCEFDSQFTDYKVTSPECPFRRDVVKELADACHQAGILFGIYYSPLDMHQPDYHTANHARYIEYLHAQVRELLSHYGKVDVIWFDGLGGNSAKDLDAEKLFAMIRELQPGIIINNGCGLLGDFDSVEQYVGSFIRERPWETCMTICRQWAWKPNDSMKSLAKCIEALVHTAGGDGNLLLNVGPMATGEIEPRQVERLAEMGRWLQKYGRSIYGTRGGPFKPGSFGVSTCRDTTIYLHLLCPPTTTVELLPIEANIVHSTLLTGGEVSVKQSDKNILISVPAGYWQEVDTIVSLELDRPAIEIKPLSTPRNPPVTGSPVTIPGGAGPGDGGEVGKVVLTVRQVVLLSIILIFVGSVAVTRRNKR